jgi:hypothetical protein
VRTHRPRRESAGPEATLASSQVRGKQLSILRPLELRLTADARRDAYLELAEHVAAGRIHIDVGTFPLERIADAWAAQARGTKTVVLL